jgi:RNA polymerase sigma-70 factor (ECF subfamily)
MHTEARKIYSSFFVENAKLIYSCIKNFIRLNNLQLNNDDIDDIYQDIAVKIIKYGYVESYDKGKSSLSTGSASSPGRRQ